MTDAPYQWIDLLWLPAALLFSRPRHRWMAAVLALACLLTFRAQLWLMSGHPDGYFGWLAALVAWRGLVGYSFGLAVFLGLAWASPGAGASIYAVAAILFYFMMFATSMLAMLL